MKLTVVTPVRNAVTAGRTEKLRRCIESVHAQTCRADIEHLVIDGASTDGTLEMLSDYAGRGWVRVISKKDHGVYEAMNNGLAEASGEYIIFLNSDDRFHSQRAMEVALKTMERSGADYGYGDVVVFGGDGRFDSYWIGSTNGLPFALNYCHQAMLVRTRVLRAYGGFDPSFPVLSDSHLMLRLYRDRVPSVHIAAFLADYELGGLSTVRENQAHADHARAFYETFGRTSGLTVDECRALWHYDGIHRLSQETSRAIGRKLPYESWRRVWTCRLGRSSMFGLRSLYGRWLMSGLRGCLASVCTKGCRLLGGGIY